jgi:hypothetical protein
VPWTRLLPHPISAGAARRYVADVLLNRGFTKDCIERATLATSEVVTEALQRSNQEPVELVVAADYPMVRVEVRDASSPDSPLGPTRSHGLLLVETLAEDWGVEQVGATRRSMWFELRV